LLGLIDSTVKFIPINLAMIISGAYILSPEKRFLIFVVLQALFFSVTAQTQPFGNIDTADLKMTD
jgi:hypothetical protein